MELDTKKWKTLGKVSLNLNLLVPVKAAFVKMAQDEGISMTELITRWVLENSPELQEELKK